MLQAGTKIKEFAIVSKITLVPVHEIQSYDDT